MNLDKFSKRTAIEIGQVVSLLFQKSLKYNEETFS